MLCSLSRLVLAAACVARHVAGAGGGDISQDAILAKTCTAEKFVMFPGGWPTTLDSSIYWFGMNNEVERSTGNKSRFYDPTKKTIIFIDGFNGLYHVKSCHRMTSKCVPLAQCESGSTFIANPWVQKGYNFGIFFWDQLADEDCVFAAELKVWGYHWNAEKQKNEPNKHLTWKSYDPVSKQTQTRNYHGPETSVAQLCASSMRLAMPSFSGPSLQIVGFSLGAQLAAACADRMKQDTPKHPAAPTLLVLLEPAFTAKIKPWSAMPFHACTPFRTKGKETLLWTVQAVERLWNSDRDPRCGKDFMCKPHNNVPMALYKSGYMSRCCYPSDIIFDPGTELDVLGTHVRWNPTFCGSLDYPCQHDVIVPFFFFNMGDTPLAIEGSSNLGPQSGACKVPGPLCTDAEIRDIVTQRRNDLKFVGHGKSHLSPKALWKQVKGMETWSVEDDVFAWGTSSDQAPKLPDTFQQDYNLGGFMAGGLIHPHGTVLPALAAFFFLLGCLACGVVRFREDRRLPHIALEVAEE